MAESGAAHKEPWMVSQLVFYPALAIGGLLEWATPSSLPEVLPTIRVIFGASLIAVGVGLLLAAKRTLSRFSQPSKPGKPTTHLIETGPFAFSRNPTYLSAVLIWLGFAIVANSAWLIITTVTAAIIADRWLIRSEEVYLARTFAEKFDDYRRRTRRWL